MVAWAHEKGGLYSVRSAYRLLKHMSNQDVCMRKEVILQHLRLANGGRF